VPQETGWGDLPNWNEEKSIRNPYREPTDTEKRMARYFYFYVQEDAHPRLIPSFMARVVDA